MKDKTEQLAAEEVKTSEGERAFQGRESCLSMLRADRDESKKVYESLTRAAEAADSARDAKAKAVEEIKSSSRSRISAMKVQIQCESSVLNEQELYVASLADRLRQGPLQTPVIDGAEGGLDQRGAALVGASAAAVSGLLSDLRDELREREGARESTLREREKAEREAAVEGQRLEDQRSAMVEALHKLADYERELGSKLADLPPNTIQPPSTIISPATAPPIDLTKLRSSAELADEASLVIDRVARARRSSHAKPGSKASRPASPTEVAAHLEIHQRHW